MRADDPLEGVEMGLRIGDTAPDFEAETTEGKINFHDWIGESWAVLFSHPKDFTPVCTTELGYMAKLRPEFDKRNVKIIGLSVDATGDHEKWADDIEETQGARPNYPLIGDADFEVSKAYGMLPAETTGDAKSRTPADNQTVRNVFVIGPDKKIKLILVYPMTTGRNFDEVLRVIDSLQLTAKHRVSTPVNWKSGEDVIIAGSVSNDEATAVERSWLPANPYMSSSGANSMHADSYASDSHPWSGPVDPSATVTFSGKGPCAGMGVTREHLLLLQCGGAQNFTLRLVDPTTLKDLATYNLPPRPSTLQAAENADLDKVYSDSSGAYFYLDNRDRAVVADAAQHIQRIKHVQAQDGTWSFVQTDDWDLSRYLPHDCTTYTNPFPQGECDPVTGVLPDWHGLLWWITRHGRVGTLDPRTGKVHITVLRGEEIENSHAVGEDGVSVVSDHALY